MKIRKVNGIYRDDGNEKLGILPSVGIGSENLDECIEVIQSDDIKRIFGHPNFGFKEDNFDFLKRIPHVKQLHFWDVSIRDIEGVYCLDALESISIEPKRPGIDFSKLSKLKKIITDYHKNDSGFDVLSEVTTFHSWNFKPKEKSFRLLALPPNIVELEITKANPLSLVGLPKLAKLKSLGVHYCRNIETIEHILDIAPNLEKLIVEKCHNLKNYEIIKEMKKIKFANINGKTIIIKGVTH